TAERKVRSVKRRRDAASSYPDLKYLSASHRPKGCQPNVESNARLAHVMYRSGSKITIGALVRWTDTANGPGSRGERACAIRPAAQICALHRRAQPCQRACIQRLHESAHWSLAAEQRLPIVVEALIVHADGERADLDIGKARAPPKLDKPIRL